MSDPPLVAVVTPVYNGARYLAECLASVQAQTYPRLVHVVLDNASTDGTAEILARFGRGRVPLLVRRNAATVPMVENWNAAVALVPSEARYFRLQCADDTMAPTAIERKVAVAERDPRIGLVGCHWRADGLCGVELPVARDVFPPEDIVRRYLRRETMVLSGMFTLIRRDPAARGPFYDASLLGFDGEAHLRLLSQGSLYGFVHEELVAWRQHADSVTQRVADASKIHMAEWLTLLDRYGPGVMGADEFERVRRAYRRHYLRRLAVMRARGQRALFAQHMSSLRRAQDAAGPVDFADALADWLWLLLRGRRGQVGRAVDAGSLTAD